MNTPGEVAGAAVPGGLQQEAALAFTAELTRRRIDRGMTKKQLAARMGFDPSYVSHIEGQRHRPTEDFARRAEAVLNAEGAIWRRYVEFDQVRHAGGPGALLGTQATIPAQWLPPGTGLVIELEEAQLTYHDAHYDLVVRRALYNAGAEPVTRYLMRIDVDRYPGQPERSRNHHREHPLEQDQLCLHAWLSTPGRPLRWQVSVDRDAFKEVWLLFEGDEGKYPLYPGERTTLDYRYTVSELQWGCWLERMVRLPTKRLVVQLRFPARHPPQVWGMESSLTTHEAPLRTPMERVTDGDRELFTWRTDSPALHTRFRWHWRWPG